MKTFDLICTTLLMVTALCVFIGLVLHANMWLLICAYWLTLTIKNTGLFGVLYKKTCGRQ